MTMMKIQYNDDALYQEMMTSLEPGAAEYDRMMASREAPAKRKKTVYWYGFAASVIGFLAITAMFFAGNKISRQEIANTDTTIPKDKYISAKDTPVTHKTEADDVMDRHTAETTRKHKAGQPAPAAPSDDDIFTVALPEMRFSPAPSDSNMTRSSAKTVVPHGENDKNALPDYEEMIR